MKNLLAFGVVALSTVLVSSANAASVPCAAQIRANAAEYVRSSSEFKNEDPGQAIGIYSIDLSQGSDGKVDVWVTYGSAREGSDGAAEMDLTATVGGSCQNISLSKSE